MDDERGVDSGVPGSRWPAVLSSPRFWIPAGAAATALAVALGLALVGPVARERAAAEVPRVTASPGDDAAIAAPSLDATPEAAVAPSTSPSAPASAEPEALPLEADRTPVTACVPDLALPVALQAATQVLPGDKGARSADVEAPATTELPEYVDAGFSADGARVAAVEHGEGAYTVRLLEAQGMASVLDLPSIGAPSLAWNPTRTLLAVVRGVGDDAVEVSTIDTLSGEQTLVAQLAGAGTESVVWSADGACLAVAVRDTAASGADGDPRAYRISTVRLSDGAVTAIDTGVMPGFAEDGTLIYRKVDGGRLELWSSSLDGTRQGVLGSGAGKLFTARTVVTAPALSADRSTVAYAEQSSPVSIRVVDVEGVHDSLATTLDLPWARVRWMPDGVTLLVDDCDGSVTACEVWLVDSVSGAAEQVKVPHARGTALDYPTPLPDGSGIVVMVGRPASSEKPAAAWPVVVRDGEAARLSDPQPGYAASAPVWSPDGDRLLLSLGPVPDGDQGVAGRFLVTRR
ncbi:hypothetical protein [Demequina gelatinilytica]|uniref:hypothetical protein n=1 Tax=Demequina gelatinilytica TaxID=1638980 RepID=UPI0007810907|nr:hypothetical protein [Demequina gelatinilytica]